MHLLQNYFSRESIMTSIPSTIEQLTPEIMTLLLAKKQPGIVVVKSRDGAGSEK